ncbi:hypothetical protein AVEN_203203-1, partial [Araneus ventricosus]
MKSQHQSRHFPSQNFHDAPPTGGHSILRWSVYMVEFCGIESRTLDPRIPKRKSNE